MPHGKSLNTKYIKYKNIYFTASEHKHILRHDETRLSLKQVRDCSDLQNSSIILWSYVPERCGFKGQIKMTRSDI